MIHPGMTQAERELAIANAGHKTGYDSGVKAERERCDGIVIAALPRLNQDALRIARMILTAIRSGKPLDELCDDNFMLRGSKLREGE